MLLKTAMVAHSSYLGVVEWWFGAA